MKQVAGEKANTWTAFSSLSLEGSGLLCLRVPPALWPHHAGKGPRGESPARGTTSSLLLA